MLVIAALVQKPLTSMRSWRYSLGWSENPLPIPVSSRASPLLPFGGFQESSVKVFNPFHVDFGTGKTQVLNHLLHMDTQLPQHYLLKKVLFSSLNVLGTFWQEPGCYSYMDYFWVLLWSMHLSFWDTALAVTMLLWLCSNNLKSSTLRSAAPTLCFSYSETFVLLHEF